MWWTSIGLLQASVDGGAWWVMIQRLPGSPRARAHCCPQPSSAWRVHAARRPGGVSWVSAMRASHAAAPAHAQGCRVFQGLEQALHPSGVPAAERRGFRQPHLVRLPRAVYASNHRSGRRPVRVRPAVAVAVPARLPAPVPRARVRRAQLVPGPGRERPSARQQVEWSRLPTRVLLALYQHIQVLIANTQPSQRSRRGPLPTHLSPCTQLPHRQ